MNQLPRCRLTQLLSLLCWLLLACLAGACRQLVGIDGQLTVSSGGTSAEGQDQSVTCASYCDDVMAACQGDLAVYAAAQHCLALCASLVPRSPSKLPGGNTLACRAAEARAALTQPEAHCRSAGPGGAGVCGTDCDAYCELYPQLCPDDVTYTSTIDCLNICSDLTDQDRYSVLDDHEGDTIECRLVHLTSASMLPREHCPHAGLLRSPPWCISNPKAAPTCSDYCKIVLSSCTDDNAQFESNRQCLDVCAALEPGTNADIMENTVGCRLYHAYTATLSPETHCSDAGPAGDGHCGDQGFPREGRSGNCDSYCRLVEAACPTEFSSQLGNADQCLAECLGLAEAAPDSRYTAAEGQTSHGLSCRVLRAARAFAEPDACAAALGAAPCN